MKKIYSDYELKDLNVIFSVVGIENAFLYCLGIFFFFLDNFFVCNNRTVIKHQNVKSHVVINCKGKTS